MLIIVEIALTVMAWRRGWKAWALLPMFLGVSLSFAFGLALAASGVNNMSAILPFAVLFDIAIIVALSCMARTNRAVTMPVAISPVAPPPLPSAIHQNSGTQRAA